MTKAVRIMLAGEGGQGVQSVAQILAEAADGAGREVLYIPNFGVEQRGGVSIAFVQIGDEAIGSPKFAIGDVVVALSARAVARTRRYVGPATLFVYDTGIGVDPSELPSNAGRVLGIGALAVAKEELHPRVFNIIVMGAVIKATGVVEDAAAREAIEKRLGYKFAKDPGLRDLNFRAVERGAQLADGRLQVEK